MNEYRVQRLKEELTFAQQRNRHQKQQLSNYKKVHEKDLKEIERLNNIINTMDKEIDNLCKNQKKEIERLNNIINELEDSIVGKINVLYQVRGQSNAIQELSILLRQLQELKGSNEPSFEEMVGFVENVYKDIKSQPTLHEELEEERKTIAKIVDDFKEANK